MENTHSKSPSSVNARPSVSLVMPCYNEEEVIGYTIPRLLSTFQQSGYRLELIAVDNGSSDRTGEIIQQLISQYDNVIFHRVEQNKGYGNGILCGLPLCTAPWVGFLPADGQVDAEDVVRLYEAAIATNGWVVGKVRRRFRMDGTSRKVVSIVYNLFVRLLWPGLGSLDINGIPKLMPRDLMMAMELTSKDWLLDPEIMIKAHYMGVRILELNVFARMRSSGVSHVRPSTIWEFFSNLLVFRFGELSRRKYRVSSLPAVAKTPEFR